MIPTIVEPLRVGATFHGRYEVERVIKSGGMGTVYEVLDNVTRRSRALKTMLTELVADSDLLSRFRLEATIAADVDSSHIVEIFDAGIDEATKMPYLVMELLKGQDLGTLLEANGRLEPADVIVYLRQTALALDKTHARGIVHRDLKPENLFLTTLDDESAHIKVLDFGIAKVTSQSGIVKTTRNVGTPLYMSPEQIRGDGTIGTASDRYACGHIAFTLLVGESYWSPEATMLSSAAPFLIRVLQGKPERATVRARARGVELPPAFDAWFERATAAEPLQRFATVREQVDSLAAVLDVPLGTSNRQGQTGGTPSGQSSQGLDQPKARFLPNRTVNDDSSPWAHRHLGLWAIALMAVALVGATALLRSRKAVQTGAGPESTLVRASDRSAHAVTAKTPTTTETPPGVANRAAAPVPAATVPSLPSRAAKSASPSSSNPQVRRGAARSKVASPTIVDPTDIR